MAYLIGVVLTVAICLFALVTGLSKDRSFYPTILIVVALYYVLFAAMAGSLHAVLVESLVMCVFAALAVVGLNRNSWLVVVGLAGHGVFDIFHPQLRLTSSVPSWWPAFCMSADVTLALFAALLLKRSSAPRPHAG